MASRRRESLKPHLARIRIWVDEGRTDFWIAHELGSTAPTIATFRRANGVLRVPGEAPEHVPAAEPAEAAAPAGEARAPRARRARRPAGEAAAPVEETPAPPARARRSRRAAEPVEVVAGDETAAAPTPAAEEGGERRRSRRGGRRRSAGQVEALEVEGVLEDGTEGYGLWLDAAVAASDVYRRHWAGQRALVVRVEADQIVIRRAPDATPPDA